AFLTLWAAYGFQIGTMPSNLPTFPQLTGVTLPLSHHLEQLLDIGGRLQKSTPAFLAGNYSDSGWWTYFPVAFLLKTPLPTLILLLLAFSSLFWLAIKQKLGDRWLTIGALLIPPVGYFTIALTSEINLGYRHLLPILPFLIVFISTVLFWFNDFPQPQRRSERQELKTLRSLRLCGLFFRPVLIGAVGWLIVSALWLYPSYLTFFNGLAGGPDGGWRYLVDSNIDWGQDLGNLKVWMDENEVDQVWLSYFGEGRPSYYSINYIGLDSFPPRLMNPQTRPFYPHDPAPGIYAISATNLQGVHFANRDLFAWFREREPIAKIGYSIFIYDVPPRGQPTDLVLAGVQLDEIAPNDFTRFKTNNLTLHWIDPTEGFLWPESDSFWLAISKDETVHFFFSEWLAGEEKISETEEYLLFQVNPEEIERSVLQTFSQKDRQIAFMGFSIPGEGLQSPLLLITTRWQNQSSPIPIKLFIHLIDDKENIVAQWDGLSIAWEGFHKGDELLQIQQFELPDSLASGSYQVRAGIYHPETGERWTTPTDTDFIVLEEFIIP
ncbi:hypothetical protein MNBD_CHLOROFLEXI01-4245, partial [hydrothermal vent metagenome]